MTHAMRRASLAPLLVLALTLVGCGGDDAPSRVKRKDGDGGPTAGTNGGGGGGNEFPYATATATVKGKVTYKGQRPAMARIPISGDSFCEHAHSELPVDDVRKTVVNEDMTIWNVVVFVESADLAKYSYKESTNPVELDQDGCIYKPHAFAMMASQTLVVKNSDDTTHNVHWISKTGAEGNFTQRKGQEDTVDVDRPQEGFLFKCDIHSWMGAFAVVLKHPFSARTGESGTFELPKLPVGTWKITAWHEVLGKTSQTVTVADGETKDITIEFAAQ